MDEEHREGSISTATHWGAYRVEVDEGRVSGIRPIAQDRDPSPIGLSIPGTVQDRLRIPQPMVRKGWLEGRERSDRADRGAEPFIALDWGEALDLLAGEIARIRDAHGPQAIFGGSYGWASAGRFHHAQSQIHRFLNMAGGYTRSVNAYSYAAAEVILPHVVASLREVLTGATDWGTLARHGELVVMFGGIPLKNAQVNSGGVAAHSTRESLERCRENGVRFVYLGPIRDDAADFLDATWLQLRPNTDVAIMLAIAHTLVAEGLHDEAFLHRYCVGFERFRPYLMGEADGQPKDAGWAAAISGLDAEAIRYLAREMARSRTLVSLSWSLQRADHGEQPYWMAVTLAAMLGQIGLPGGGFGCGYGAIHGVGNPNRQFGFASFPQGRPAISSFIPVARIADMLLRPGEPFDYDGKRHSYPDVRMVYWAGGNPFHHHQDLNRLLAAWRRPETIVVHEPWWNTLARHADIVLPATTPLERKDIAATTMDGFIVAMKQAIPPVDEARSDHDIFRGLAARLGFEEAFTEGRDEMGWLRHLYDRSRQEAARHGMELPSFERFWEEEIIELPKISEPRVLLEAFRKDPEAHPLRTPSGRIEIFSETIAGFAYDDCPPHPAWLEPIEWLGSRTRGRNALHLISNQPRTRLHSQLDQGITSRKGKTGGRETVWINPLDAAERGIEDGDVVRLFNGRGQCLAGALLSDEVQAGVVMLPTGAWYDPKEPGVVGTLETHGNPNVLTIDKGCSKLSQGPSAHSCLVEIERYEDEPPPVRAFEPPPVLARERSGRA
jgi:biotin/methionine sulfoxide reductase